MAVSDENKFIFDVRGYIHLRGALPVDEIAEYEAWMAEAVKINANELNAGRLDDLKHQLNRPLSRVLDADPRFARFLDHPKVEPFLAEFLGENYRHIDNEIYHTHPGYKGGPWHRGVRSCPAGHVREGRFICPMVKVFYCMSDVGPGEGEFEVVPGSHRASFEIPTDGRIDLPLQHVFNDVTKGDIILFDEGLLHNGRPNLSQKTRKTIIMNFGREDAGVWPGYKPSAATLAAISPRHRSILSNTTPVWAEPQLM